jgi:hypothetical protein
MIFSMMEQYGEKLTNNIKINFMPTTRPIGSFSGSISFLNVSGQGVTIDHVSDISLSSSDEAIGTVTLPANSISFTGTGLAAGTITLTLNFTNDQGAIITATTELTFTAAPDTTAVSGAIRIN